MRQEPKPVVTMDGENIRIDGRLIGELGYGGSACLDGKAWIGDVDLMPAELRALADWLDQWDGATLLSQVVEG